MATTTKRVESALEREGLRRYVGAIYDCADGEVVVCCGPYWGRSVYSVRQALELAQQVRDWRAEEV